jgi:hypothetical protein
MAQQVTSLADFFRKAETGLEYQDAACRAYETFYGSMPEWNNVKQKIEQWAKDNVGVSEGFGDHTCARMVEYLNLFIQDPTYRRQ